ncbi:MAG: WGR domain-containing protein [Candidatus Sericytochromatia bacterium]
MRRFEFSQGSSNKFWEVAIDGSSLLTRWGRIGSKGQEKTKTFPSSEAAKQEQDKLVTAKLREGYREIGAVQSPPPEPAWSEPGHERWNGTGPRPGGPGSLSVGDAARYEGQGKFWEYECVRQTLATRSGQVGSEGVSQVNCFPSFFEAASARNAEIEKLTKAGYCSVPGFECLIFAAPQVAPLSAEPSPTGFDLIQRLDHWLREHRPEFYETLNPGNSPEVLADWERETALSPAAGNVTPDEFQILPQIYRELYLWKNGQQTEDVGLVDRFCLNPLTACYLGQPIPGAITFLDSLSWREMISIDMLGLLDGPEGKKPGQIIWTNAYDMSGWVICPSLEKWIEVLVTALEEGCASGVDEKDDTRLPASFEIAYIEVLQRICPGYWGEDQDLHHLWV